MKLKMGKRHGGGRSRVSAKNQKSYLDIILNHRKEVLCLREKEGKKGGKMQLEPRFFLPSHLSLKMGGEPGKVKVAIGIQDFFSFLNFAFFKKG